MTTVREILAEARGRLVAAGLDPHDARTDAEVLAREAFGWDRARLLANRGEEAPPGGPARLAALVVRRSAREPVSQILGRREFRGLQFEVTADVLTPRPESELIVEEGLARLADTERRWRIAEVGTGSGCLAVSLAVELPHATVVATDLSEAALALARRNAARHGVSKRVQLVRTSLLEGVHGPFDLVASNPPYVTTGEMAALPPEVRDHEPWVALDGGPDGLDVVRVLIAGSAPLLSPGGWLVFEIGAGQDATAAALVQGNETLELVGVRTDLAGIARTVTARRRLSAHGRERR